MLKTYEDLAKMIDHSLLRPELTEAEVVEGCRLAVRYGVATVCVRPADLDLARPIVEGSGVLLSTVIGFPHGDSTTETKLFEARDAIARGARELDMVLNIGRLRSRDFSYVEQEIGQLAAEAHRHGVILKVILENAYLTDELKIEACRICERAGADFVKTSTGFAPTGATAEDLRLMRASTGPKMRVKAAGGIRTLDRAIEAHDLGCSRIGATATAKILDEWKARLQGC